MKAAIFFDLEYNSRSPPVSFDFTQVQKNRKELINMKKWQKDRNYRKFTNEDGTVKHIITIDGIDTEVNAEVYKAYSQADRRERYCAECNARWLLSLDKLSEDNVPFLCDKPAESLEDSVFQKLLVTKIFEVLEALLPDERALIQAILINGKTEQEYADIIGVSQVAVHKRKKRILKNILKIFSDYQI
ncbi:MAG: RNA polymerase subunit sigma-70 [Oscillospiraceae bacterium]|nr:RNA polymerase subunit sigma-70 [Oscillospiraceae bacterium]